LLQAPHAPHLLDELRGQRSTHTLQRLQTQHSMTAAAAAAADKAAQEPSVIKRL
jgi:hypothetical protein